MLNIDEKIRRKLVADAERTFPDECCGFLFGHENGPDRRIVEMTVVDNAKEGDRRRRFEISPRDYLQAERHALEKGWELLGIYHSHPDHPAVPSEHDRVAAQPYFSYVILSVLGGRYDGLRSWRLNDDARFDEEPVG